MKILTNYNLFIEASNTDNVKTHSKYIYNNSGLVLEICVSMLLLNNEFLDDILDRGIRARYINNSHSFITDLKNLLLAKNRLVLGIFNVKENKYIEDVEIAKINKVFEDVDFDIEKDWNTLIKARNISRNIIDKLLSDQKLSEDLIKKIYWLGPNQSKDNRENIVIELTDTRQLSFYLNRSLTMSKSSSFNTFASDIIGNSSEKIFSVNYIKKWNRLVQEWIKVIYNNANKNIQLHIEKFIEPKRIDSIGYFNFFNIKHSDFRYKHIGEYLKEFDKNLLYFSELLGEIWKNKDVCFSDPKKVYNDWMERKILIMNSKILENIFTSSLIENNLNNIKKLDDGYKLAEGSIKMKLIKTIVEKLHCSERPIYFLGNSGNTFNQVPERSFFRKNYDSLSVKFDYHVKMTVDETEEENNDFVVKLILELDGKILMNINISVVFSSYEMSGKLVAKYNFIPSLKFNTIISDFENSRLDKENI